MQYLQDDEFFNDDLMNHGMQAVELGQKKRELENSFLKDLKKVKPFADVRMDKSGNVVNFKAEQKFFDMVSDLSGYILCTPMEKTKGVTKGSKKGIRNFMCRTLTGRTNYSYEDFCRFYVTHGLLVSALDRAYLDVPMNRGDDGFGDLLDSLCFAGQSVIERIFNGELSTCKLLEKAVEAELGHNSKFVLQGENYIGHYFSEHLLDFLPSFVRRMQEGKD